MQNPNEQFYEVDKDDNPIGPISRKEANSNNQKYHRAINVFVKINDQYLITVRDENKDTFPNRFDLSVSGHVNYGEEYIGAAVRETKEELGIDTSLEDYIELGKLLVEMPHENEYQMNYLLELGSEKKENIKALEASYLIYVTLDKMLESIDQETDKWADWAFQSIKYFRKKLS